MEKTGTGREIGTGPTTEMGLWVRTKLRVWKATTMMIKAPWRDCSTRVEEVDGEKGEDKSGVGVKMIGTGTGEWRVQVVSMLKHF